MRWLFRAGAALLLLPLAGLIGLVRAGVFSKSDRLLFLHTGGTPGLFAYAPELISMVPPG